MYSQLPRGRRRIDLALCFRATSRRKSAARGKRPIYCYTRRSSNRVRFDGRAKPAACTACRRRHRVIADFSNALRLKHGKAVPDKTSLFCPKSDDRAPRPVPSVPGIIGLGRNCLLLFCTSVAAGFPGPFGCIYRDRSLVPFMGRSIRLRSFRSFFDKLSCGSS